MILEYLKKYWWIVAIVIVAIILLFNRNKIPTPNWENTERIEALDKKLDSIRSENIKLDSLADEMKRRSNTNYKRYIDVTREIERLRNRPPINDDPIPELKRDTFMPKYFKRKGIPTKDSGG